MCDFTAYASTTNYPLATTGGSYTGYAFVTVDRGVGGYSTHKFVGPAESPDSPITSFPFAPVTSFEWRRGLMLEQTSYKKQDNNPKLVSFSKDKYLSDVSSYATVLGLKVGQYSFLQSDCRLLTDAELVSSAKYETFETATEFQYLDSQTERRYNFDNDNIFVETVTSYQYDPDYFHRIQSDFTDSKELVHSTHYKYATDFTDNTYGSNLLRDLHMHQQVLEQTTKVDNTIVYKSTTSYSIQKNNTVPSTILVYPSGGNDAINTEFEYDNYANIRQSLGKDGVPVAYIWGYNNSLPVAKIEGATFQKIEDIFEEDFDAGAAALTPSQEQTLRSQLPQALITTYTYDLLKGITSQTDPSGKTTFYQYDGMRLQLTKDHNGHITSYFKYHYLGR